MPRRFLTQRDVDDLADGGCTELLVDDDTTLTDLARERARERGVSVVRGGEAAGAASAPAAAGSSASSGVTVAPEDRGRIRAEVRAAVIAQLGGEPPSLERVIDRVLDGLV